MSEFVAELSALMKKHKAFFYIYPKDVACYTDYMLSINVRQDGFPEAEYSDGNNDELAVLITRGSFITPDILCDVIKMHSVYLNKEI